MCSKMEDAIIIWWYMYAYLLEKNGSFRPIFTRLYKYIRNSIIKNHNVLKHARVIRMHETIWGKPGFCGK